MSEDEKKGIKDVYKDYRKIKKQAREIRKQALGRLNDEENASIRTYTEATKTRRAVKAEIFGNAGKMKDTKVEIFVENLIKEQGWKYIPQKAVRYLNYDFYLTDLNVLLEVQGDYWHCNPRVYPDGPKNSVQRENLQKNKNKREVAESQNIPLLEIWELDIEKDPDGTKKQILDFVEVHKNTNKFVVKETFHNKE